MGRKYLLSATFVSMTLIATNAFAADKYWICGDGLWNDGSCWSPFGQPIGGTVWITQTDNINRTVTYLNSISPSPKLYNLTIDSTGTGTMTLFQGQDNLTSRNEYIGFDGVGNFNQNDGIHTIDATSYSYGLRLGNNSGSTGTYTMSGGSLTVTNSATGAHSGWIGYDGTGIFNQTGGTHTSGGGLLLGARAGSSGTYNLSGGDLMNDRVLYVGFGGAGAFNHSNGSSTVNTLHISAGTDSEGKYNLSGGSLVANKILLRGKGIFDQSGGINTIDHLIINGSSDITNTYDLSAGTLTTNKTSLGEAGIYGKGGLFKQSDGTHKTGTLELRLGGGTGVASRYDLIGGRLEATNIIVGDGNTFNFDGGTLAVDNFMGNLINNGGVLAPGESPGITNVDGDYTQFIAGIFEVEIGGLVQGSEHDWLNITGTATLGGTLDVDLFDLGSGLFAPSDGDVFDILSAETITGEFDLLTLAALGEGLHWDISYLTDFSGTTDIVRLSVSTVPIPPAVWLFGSGLIGLIGLARRKA